jgi:hypothetical protein
MEQTLQQTLYSEGTDLMTDLQTYAGIAPSGSFVPDGGSVPRAGRPVIMQT